jgi:hypothetical protein
LTHYRINLPNDYVKALETAVRLTIKLLSQSFALKSFVGQVSIPADCCGGYGKPPYKLLGPKYDIVKLVSIRNPPFLAIWVSWVGSF